MVSPKDGPKKPTQRFWESYSALYGNGSVKKRSLHTGSRIKEKARLERHEQIDFVKWCKAKGLRVAANMNEGRRSKRNGASLQAAGLSAGHPDVQIYAKRKGSGSLFIEMKRTKGSVISDEQREWVAWLNANGYTAHFAYGAEDAKRLTEQYLALPVS